MLKPAAIKNPFLRSGVNSSCKLEKIKAACNTYTVSAENALLSSGVTIPARTIMSPKHTITSMDANLLISKSEVVIHFVLL